MKYRKESEKIEMKGNVKDAMETVDKTWPVTLPSVNAYMPRRLIMTQLTSDGWILKGWIPYSFVIFSSIVYWS